MMVAAAPGGESGWIVLITAALGGGGIKYLIDAFKEWRHAPPRELKRQSLIDASILTVAKARDELEEDNLRLRAILAEERRNWAAERERYARERVQYRADISTLEEQIRAERTESTRRYDALLARVAELSARHTPQKGPMT